MKRTKWNRIIVMILVAAMLLTSLPLAALAEEAVTPTSDATATTEAPAEATPTAESSPTTVVLPTSEPAPTAVVPPVNSAKASLSVAVSVTPEDGAPTKDKKTCFVSGTEPGKILLTETSGSGWNIADLGALKPEDYTLGGAFTGISVTAVETIAKKNDKNTAASIALTVSGRINGADSFGDKAQKEGTVTIAAGVLSNTEALVEKTDIVVPSLSIQSLTADGKAVDVSKGEAVPADAKTVTGTLTLDGDIANFSPFRMPDEKAASGYRNDTISSLALGGAISWSKVELKNGTGVQGTYRNEIPFTLTFKSVENADATAVVTVSSNQNCFGIGLDFTFPVKKAEGAAASSPSPSPSPSAEVSPSPSGEAGSTAEPTPTPTPNSASIIDAGKAANDTAANPVTDKVASALENDQSQAKSIAGNVAEIKENLVPAKNTMAIDTGGKEYQVKSDVTELTLTLEGNVTFKETMAIDDFAFENGFKDLTITSVERVNEKKAILHVKGQVAEASVGTVIALKGDSLSDAALELKAETAIVNPKLAMTVNGKSGNVSIKGDTKTIEVELTMINGGTRSAFFKDQNGVENQLGTGDIILSHGFAQSKVTKAVVDKNNPAKLSLEIETGDSLWNQVDPVGLITLPAACNVFGQKLEKEINIDNVFLNASSPKALSGAELETYLKTLKGDAAKKEDGARYFTASVSITGGTTRKNLGASDFAFSDDFKDGQVLSVDQKSRNVDSLTVTFKLPKSNAAAGSTAANSLSGTIGLKAGTLAYQSDSTKVGHVVSAALTVASSAPATIDGEIWSNTKVRDAYYGIMKTASTAAAGPLKEKIKEGYSWGVEKVKNQSTSFLKNVIGLGDTLTGGIISLVDKAFGWITGNTLSGWVDKGLDKLTAVYETAAPPQYPEEVNKTLDRAHLVLSQMEVNQYKDYFNGYSSKCNSLDGNYYSIYNPTTIETIKKMSTTIANDDGMMSGVDMSNMDAVFKKVYSSEGITNTGYLGAFNQVVNYANGKNFTGVTDAGIGSKDIFQVYYDLEGKTYTYNTETFNNREKFNQTVKAFVDRGYYVLEPAISFRYTYDQLKLNEVTAQLAADPGNKELTARQSEYDASMKQAKDNLTLLETEYQEFQYNYAASEAVLKWEAHVAGVTITDPGIAVASADIVDYPSVTDPMIYCYATNSWFYKNCKGGNPSTDDGYNATAGLVESDHKTLTQYYLGYYADGGIYHPGWSKALIYTKPFCMPYYVGVGEQFNKDAQRTGTIFAQTPTMNDFGSLKAAAQKHNETTMEKELAQAGFMVNGQSYTSYQQTEGSSYKGIYVETVPSVDIATWWGGVWGRPDIFTRKTAYFSGDKNTMVSADTMKIEMNSYTSCDGNMSNISRLGGPAYTTGADIPAQYAGYKAMGLDPNLLGNNNIMVYYPGAYFNVFEKKAADALYEKLKATNPNLKMTDLWRYATSSKLGEEAENVRNLTVQWDFSVVYMRKVPTNLEPTQKK